MRSRLDYIGEVLGADGIWLMPVMPSPTYHKYDVTDYFDIDPEYGTLEDFDALCWRTPRARDPCESSIWSQPHFQPPPLVRCRGRGTVDGEPAPYEAYYNFTTEDRGEGYARITDKYFYECRFWSGMPDLNLDHPKYGRRSSGSRGSGWTGESTYSGWTL